MSYRIDVQGDPADELRRVAGEQLDKAARRLREDHDADPVDAIHATRKALKKTRSLLRLARPGMRKKAYRVENRALRDLARSISTQRDADVMAETVGDLADRYAGQLPAATFDAVRARFAAEGEQARSGAAGADPEAVAEQLAAARDRSAAWPLSGVGLDALVEGATRAYARGRSAYADARKRPSTERLHDWRKRSKDLWYHARLLRGAWPAQLGATAKEAHRLADALGDDHDLAVLADRLAGGERALDAAVDEDELLALIERRRAELQSEAMLLGARLYAERPKAFARRLRRYLA